MKLTIILKNNNEDINLKKLNIIVEENLSNIEKNALYNAFKNTNYFKNNKKNNNITINIYNKIYTKNNILFDCILSVDDYHEKFKVKIFKK